MHLFLILGNQLFSPQELNKHIKVPDSCTIFMREDFELCQYFQFHKQKIIFFLASMRDYADELKQHLFKVHYEKLEKSTLNYEVSLKNYLVTNSIKFVQFFEIEDQFFEQRILALLKQLRIEYQVIRSPMFLTSRTDFKSYLTLYKKPFMKSFYESQRKKYKILMEGNKPMGGRWSFDTENRKGLPKDLIPPELPNIIMSPHTTEVTKLVEKHFVQHPGSAAQFWLPTTRKEANKWLEVFFKERFAQFGPYEDALPAHSDIVFHSVLSPLLNIGLLTPQDVIKKCIAYAQNHAIPIQSLEGFVRQILGWREFIRGIYQNFGEQQQKMNFWNHQNKLSPLWYSGETGIPFLDRILNKVIKRGYLHHIERLMVIGNLMLLLEVHPQAAYRWFMEMFVDSSDWVMVPNVFGMALYADGGLFATKPYICGSNYFLKMSGEKKAPWCAGIDGLYWGFIKRNQAFFLSNPRTALVVNLLNKLPPDRFQQLESEAQKLRDRLIIIDSN